MIGGTEAALGSRVRPLDGLRGVAILVVVLYHLEVPPFNGGYIGVELFFVLSGFLISSLLIREVRDKGRLDLGRFFARRGLRLLPALGALIVGVLVLSYAFDSEFRADAPRSAAAAFFYFGNWANALDWWNMGLFHHTWSLAIEEQFYLVWPASLALLVRARRWQWAGAVAATAFVVLSLSKVVMWASGVSLARIYNGTDTRAPALMLGCTLAWLVARGWTPKPQQLQIAGPVALVAFSLLAIVTRADSEIMVVFGLLLVQGVCAVLVLCAIAPTPSSVLHTVLVWRPLVALGTVSYGLYLWHKALALMLTTERLGGREWLEVPVELLASAVCTIASWYLVERPFLRLKDRFGTHTARDLVPAP